MDAATLPTGVYAEPSDFHEGQPASDALLARLDRAVDQFAPWLSQTQAASSAA